MSTKTKAETIPHEPTEGATQAATAAQDGPKASPAKAPSKGKIKAKAAKPKKSEAAGAGTLRDLAERYIAQIEKDGKSEGTLFSYRMELRTAFEELGEETQIAKLSTAKVKAFFESDRVTKTRTGIPKSPLSIAKTQRVLRQALTFAVEAGLIEKAPLPE